MRSGRRVEPVAGAAAGSSSTIRCRAVVVQAHKRRRRASSGVAKVQGGARGRRCEDFFTAKPTMPSRAQRAYMRVGRLFFLSCQNLPSGMSNCWRCVFIVFAKIEGCQSNIPNSWRCSNLFCCSRLVIRVYTEVCSRCIDKWIYINRNRTFIFKAKKAKK